MAKEEKAKKLVNPEAEQKNWEQRLKTEGEVVHKWNEAWGSLFDSGVPHDYDARVQYLKQKLKDTQTVQALPKYGVGPPFREVGQRDYKRKKMFRDDPLDYEDPTEFVNRTRTIKK
jgi:hypothetical protein